MNTDRQAVGVLAVSTGAAFLLTLSIYGLLSGRNPFNRLGYAAFVSVLPALIVFVLFRAAHRQVSRGVVALLYVFLFAVVVILQGIVR